MDLVKYFSVLFVLFAFVDAGGHGEKHHDHVKLHVPEFIHHDRHTKVITIHHHHHKPKEETHHHHHHVPKPNIPLHIPQPHFKIKETTTHVSKGHHGSHGHGSHHHGHHSHHSSHSHHGHHHDTPSYDPPSVNYDSPAVHYAPPQISHAPPQISHAPPQVHYPSPTYGHDYSSFVPSVPSPPHVRGVVHTVNQIKVFDSLHGALPGGAGNGGSHGYEVTEQRDENDDDVFTAVNTLSQTYPGTYGFTRSATPVQNDPFSELAQQGTASSLNHDPFAEAPQPTPFGNDEGFTDGNSQALSFQGHSGGYPNIQPSHLTSNEAGEIGFDDTGNAIAGDLGTNGYLSSAEGFVDETPVTFNREAGLQHTINSGSVQHLVY